MVNRLVSKEREIQKYMSESPSLQHKKTDLRRSGSDTADEGSSQLGPPGRVRSSSTSDMNRKKNGADAAKPHVRSASVSQSPRPPSRKKRSPVLPRILVDSNEEMDKETQVRMILSSEPTATGISHERKVSPGDSVLPNGTGAPRKKTSGSLGDVYSQNNKDPTKAYNRSKSVPLPLATASNGLPAVIPTILVDDDVQSGILPTTPEIDEDSQESNFSWTEPSPPCSPKSSPSAEPKKLHSSSTDALMNLTDSASDNSLMPVQRARAKSASSPRPVHRVRSLPVGSPDIADKKTLLEMSKNLPDMKGKDGFKQFYHSSSPKPNRK